MSFPLLGFGYSGGEISPFHKPLVLTVNISTPSGEAGSIFFRDSLGTVIDWGDGIQTEFTSGTNIAHTWASSGVYTVKIYVPKTLPSPKIRNTLQTQGINIPSLVAVEEWGSAPWDTVQIGGSANKPKFRAVPDHIPLTITNLVSMFRNCAVFNQDLSTWCVPNFLSEPSDFSYNTPAWILPKPVWGTCPVSP